MSKFLQLSRQYSANFNLGAIDRLKLLLHYPLFKLYWTAHRGAPSSLRRRVAAIGLRPWESHRFWNSLRPAGGRPVRIPISFRAGNLGSFQEIFWNNEYSLPGEIQNIQTMVDLGANAGMASLYFISRFPTLRKMVVVEANPALVPPLKSLFKQFTDIDVAVENACVSDSDGQVIFNVHPDDRLSRIGGDGTDATAVPVKSRPLAKILDDHSMGEIDLLKMDIESAEYAVMDSDPGVFRRFRHIVAEIHGSPDEQIRFGKQLAAAGFSVQPIAARPSNIFASRDV